MPPRPVGSLQNWSAEKEKSPVTLPRARPALSNFTTRRGGRHGAFDGTTLRRARQHPHVWGDFRTHSGAMLAAAHMTACVAARCPFNNGGRLSELAGALATWEPPRRRGRGARGRCRAGGRRPRPPRGEAHDQKNVMRKKTQFIEQDDEKDVLAAQMRAASAAASSGRFADEADPTPRMNQSDFERKLAAAKEKGQAVTEYRKAQEPTTMDGIIAGGWGGKDYDQPRVDYKANMAMGRSLYTRPLFSST